jgi:hypothetical protein
LPVVVGGGLGLAQLPQGDRELKEGISEIRF